MPINLKTAEEIERMRLAGRLAGEVLDFVAPHVKPGI
ncbi:MAG TPA: type I methionyl aminopeptidase, partial [Burkholderiales bacterium]|nr:type I methionyl aminopeptidase [Burkholderiales bacterium]